MVFGLEELMIKRSRRLVCEQGTPGSASSGEKSAVGAQRTELTSQHRDLGSTAPWFPHWFMSK